MKSQERGKRMAMANLAVFGSAFFTPILVGKITHTIHWQWTFYLVAIFMGVSLPFVYFFVPETAYVRSAHLNLDMASSHNISRKEVDLDEFEEPNAEAEASNTSPTSPEKVQKTTSTTQEQSLPHTSTNGTEGKKTFKETLSLFSGRKSNESFWKLFLRPLPLFAHPAILWACLIQGTMIGWTVFIGIILAAIFLGPPLFWNEVNTGYAYTGAFVGSILGFLIAGALADWSARYMTKKNRGIYEPEFRIVLVIPQLVFGCAGLYLFGVTASRLIDFHWVLPVIAFGMEVGGMVIGAVAGSLYIVDAHREFSKWQCQS
jgi:MFS family permease